MKYTIEILRQKSPTDEPYRQTFALETELKNATVATALSMLNAKTPLLDIGGKECDRIVWECSCLQKNAVRVQWSSTADHSLLVMHG